MPRFVLFINNNGRSGRNLDLEKIKTDVRVDDCDELRSSGRSLNGKIFAARYIGKDVEKKKISLKEIRPNTIVKLFANCKDSDRILEGRPWLFVNNLFVMNR